MPKVKYIETSGETAFKADMVAAHGSLASTAVVGRMIGFKSYSAIYDWLSENNISEFEIRGHKRYSVPEVAAAIWRARA